MANFDLDDPLGDLLSDGSDDSFFQEPKVTAKRASISKSPDKKSVKDLFNLDEKPPDNNKNDDWLGLDISKEKKEILPINAPRVREKPVKKISFEQDDDIFSSLGLETEKSDYKKPANKKTALMESILGPPKEDKKFLSLDDLLKDASLNKKTDPPVEVSKSTPQLNQKSETATGFGLSSLEGTREGRRSSRPRTATIADPLGLFSSEGVLTEQTTLATTPKETKPMKSSEETKVVFQTKKFAGVNESNISDVPDWLGTPDVKKVNLVKEKTTKPHSQENISKSAPNISEETPFRDPVDEEFPVTSILTQQKLATSQIEYQNTSIALQQQESQLLVALQLRKYEESLTKMQKNQQDVLVKQEQHFNTLLERQFSKQQAMESNLRLQQERINNHIQMLIGQPAGTCVSGNENVEKLNEIRKSGDDEFIKCYEEVIMNLKQRHHDEIFLLEESYKKQIATLEQSMESIENHLKSELDSVTHRCREKLEHLELEHEKDLMKINEKFKSLHEQHDQEIKDLRENNRRIIEEVKYEYNTLIDNIKLAKQKESSVLEEESSYTNKLDTSLKILEINSRALLEIKDRVDKDFNVISTSREESIKAKQEEIKMMRLALEKARESTDLERSELMSLVRNLEIKLAEQNQNSREERYAMQLAASTLAARTAAIEREAEFNRTSIEREREQLKILRESILAEQEKSIQEIMDEKLKLHSQKVHLETSSKLNLNFDNQRAKMEAETAFKVAKEATELTDKERENLYKQIGEVESIKRNLGERERKLNTRDKDLEAALEEANRKCKIGEKALDEARALQLNYNDRLKEIQAQMYSLTTRERKLAEEKIQVSKERVALHTTAKQIRKCGLCAVDTSINRIEEDYNESEVVEQDLPRYVSDADMFRLQLQMSEDQLSSNHNLDDRISLQ